MTKGRVVSETRPRRTNVKMQGGRTRTAALPDYLLPAIVPLFLFTIEDMRRLSAEAANKNPALQLRQASDAEGLLCHAFRWALRCAKMQEWKAEPQRKRRWYKQAARHANSLLRALALNPDDTSVRARPNRDKVITNAKTPDEHHLELLSSQPIVHTSIRSNGCGG